MWLILEVWRYIAFCFLLPCRTAQWVPDAGPLTQRSPNTPDFHIIPIMRFHRRIFPLFGHNDFIKWKHFPRNWPFVRGIHRSPVNSPHKGQWRGALMFSLISACINGWVYNGEAGDLRRIWPLWRQSNGYVVHLKCVCGSDDRVYDPYTKNTYLVG